jgi:hypothetical protein
MFRNLYVITYTKIGEMCHELFVGSGGNKKTSGGRLSSNDRSRIDLKALAGDLEFIVCLHDNVCFYTIV